MRKVAKKLRDEAEKMEDSKISVRREDVALKPFVIPVQNVDMQYLQTREMVTINRVVRPGAENIVSFYIPVIRKWNTNTRR